MKKIENLLLKACGYTLLTTLLFYIAALLGEFTKPAIDFPTFALIFVFGIIISAASMILYVKTMHTALKILIHYVILFIAFFVIFLLAGKLTLGGPSVVFAAIVIFTFLYALIFAAVYFIRRAVIGADKALDARVSKKNSAKKPYTPLYKTKDADNE